MEDIIWPKSYFEGNPFIEHLFDFIPDALFISNEEGKIVYVNQQAADMLNYAPEELINQPIEITMPQKIHERHVKLRESYQKDPSMRPMGRGLKLTAVNKHGKLFPVDISLSPIQTDDGKLFLAIVRDITEKVNAEEQLQEINRRLAHLAHHDPLTQLPNRLHLDQHIKREVSRAERHHKKLAVLFLDLDYFKEVNDMRGHDTGDILLEKVASRLRTSLRSEDLIARVGGDEFIIVLSELTDTQDACTTAGKIIKAIKAPYHIKGTEITIGTSIGIAIFPEHTKHSEELVKLADIAMYSAKNAGRNQYQVYKA